ncbi:thioredoxin domain-containing protein [Methanoregula sp.]|uniref:thioredoxin domain-containing protein n=1 Tax=Methanoregula sp. TaxID=2052170 RepID=UPI00356AFC23
MPHEQSGRSEQKGQSNRLSEEKSPYLLQHARNPVDWYPWGDDAFLRAAVEDKPVFLSIGYATCHWCHVMAHESFEDPDVAALLNRDFVAVKVDREERPDIDGTYMTICQLMTGQGGWPLTIIMTPGKKPFFAATYIPKLGRFGMTGLVDILTRVSRLWKDQRDDLLASAEKIVSELVTPLEQSSGSIPDPRVLTKGYENLSLMFDEAYGGFGTAPKFPAPHTVLFLLRYAKRTGNQRALKMVTKTLAEIHNGGIHDHIGGGFHRYSTDSRWRVPHFEKMLYDQALLLAAYTETFLATGTPEFRKTAEEIITYVFRHLLSPEGAFLSAEDADSPEGEGAFYLWTTEEVRRVLGTDDALLTALVYNMVPEGNVPGTENREGQNILYCTRSDTECASLTGLSVATLEQRMASIRERLYAAREKRRRPFCDDKVLADWNGLFIGALARSARAFGNELYLGSAKKAAQFVLTRMRSPDGGLFHRYRDGEAAIPGFADDYAFTISGLIELYEAGFDPQFLTAALELNTYFIKHFLDARSGGFFLVSDESEPVLIRKKELYDGAVPSANSLAMENLVRLSRLTGETAPEREADNLARWAGEAVNEHPAGYTRFLCALDYATGPATEVVICGKRDADDTRILIDAINKQYLPSLTILLLEPDFSQTLAAIAPFTRDLEAKCGKATAFLCSGHSCAQPTTDPEILLGLLGVRQNKKDGASS